MLNIAIAEVVAEFKAKLGLVVPTAIRVTDSLSFFAILLYAIEILSLCVYFLN